MELKIEGLRKRYPSGVQALNDVSLTIGPGMFGLLGPNGAGKSTLMRTIATLQEVDSGSMKLGAVDVLRQKDEVRRILGYLPQEFGMYPKVSAEDMLDHFAVLKGISNRRQRHDVVHALLRQTNLFDVRKKALGGFSGGMKQRLGIAQALLGNPKLIIVDEPTAGLDPEERLRFHNLLAEIGDDVIVILSTHIVSDVSDLCHAMAVILMRVENQPYVHYAKGSLVMYALADAIGEETVNRALRTYLEQAKYRGPPYTSTREFMAVLRREAPASALPLIHDLFEAIALYELRALSATAKQLPDRRYEVTVKASAKKLYSNGLGVETEAPLDEELAFGALDDKGNAIGIEKRRVSTPVIEVTFTVDRRPAKAGIDPLNGRIDRKPDDNVVPVEIPR